MFNFSPLKEKIKEIEEWLAKELSQVRTGRAVPTLLDAIKVESYGATVPINHIGSVTIEDSRTLRVSLWDATQGKAIEKAITAANLGVSVTSDDRGIRVFFPELTSERRVILAKLVKEKLENARVSLRKERDHAWEEIQKKETEGGMGEDDKFRLKSDMQKMIDEGGKRLDAVALRKQKEIES